MEDGGVGESGDARLGTVLINAVFVYVYVSICTDKLVMS